MGKKNKITLADQADKHELYENSVQNVEFEVEFLAQEFKANRGRDCRIFREDFCGTAQAAVEWVKQHDENRAIAVDLDEDVIDWGLKHHVSTLSDEQQSRLRIYIEDVLAVETEKVDLIAASNFSYWIFKERELMLEYFSKVFNSLKHDGALFLDAFGGYDAYKELKEETEHEDFSYIWHQKKYNPYNHDLECRIHFTFPDGSKMKNAFRYSWRLWSLPEIRELLEEAGFSKVITYAEGWDEEEEEGNGVWEATETFDADPGWLAYIVALK